MSMLSCNRFKTFNKVLSYRLKEAERRKATSPFHAYYPTRDSTEKAYLRLGGLASQTEGYIIETGTDSGCGAISMAIGSFPDGKVISCDTRLESVEYARKIAKKFKIPNVSFIHGTVKAAVNMFYGDISLAYVDGDHTVEGCTTDLDVIASRARQSGTIIAIDDFYEKNTIEGKDHPVTAAVEKWLENNKDWKGAVLWGGLMIITKVNNANQV